MGVGAKAFRQRIGVASHASLLPSAVAALCSPLTNISSVRGPKTCETLRRYGVDRVRCQGEGSLPYGDPALVAPLLLPWWSELKWKPARRVGLPPMLCYVPQMSDLAGRHQGFIESYRSPCYAKWNISLRVLSPID